MRAAAGGNERSQPYRVLAGGGGELARLLLGRRVAPWPPAAGAAAGAAAVAPVDGGDDGGGLVLGGGSEVVVRRPPELGGHGRGGGIHAPPAKLWGSGRSREQRRAARSGAVELAGLAVAVGSGRGVKRSEEAGGTEEEMRCEREKF